MAKKNAYLLKILAIPFGFADSVQSFKKEINR
jgi:hypothetical protein